MVAAGVLGAGGYGAGREATDAYEHRQQRQSIAENADLVREISERDDLTPEQKTRMYEQMVESGGLDHDPTSGSEGESRLGGLMPTFVGFNMETFFLIVLLYFGTKVVAGGS